MCVNMDVCRRGCDGGGIAVWSQRAGVHVCLFQCMYLSGSVESEIDVRVWIGRVEGEKEKGEKE